MSERIEKTRLKSRESLPELSDKASLEFIWHVSRVDSDYWSTVTLKDGTPVFREMAYSCDGKYYSHSPNHYKEVCTWIREKYGKRVKSIDITFQDFDCGCYFED
ncbi:MAG: hypothetical protein ACJ75J_01995 [Cytophagaceae bacterium]